MSETVRLLTNIERTIIDDLRLIDKGDKIAFGISFLIQEILLAELAKQKFKKKAEVIHITEIVKRK